MSGQRDQALRERAAAVMPAGIPGHLSVARRSSRVPQFFDRAEGSHLVDVDGNRYLDFMCGYGTNLLGYQHPAIDEAAAAQLSSIDTATGPSPLVVELAEAYTRQIEHADWTILCKNGTDATTIALLTARAHRGRSKILAATGAYHGATTWCTPKLTGTVEVERDQIIHYRYNDVESLQAAVEEAGDDLAGIFASPFRHDLAVTQELPTPEYAAAARSLCDERDALLILDDVRAGFRLARESSWHHLGVEPDLSAWGKALANGHPISAVMGNDRARAAAASIYVTGSFWQGAAPVAAALATLEVINTTDYLEHTVDLGQRLRDGLDSAASNAGVDLHQSGPVQMPLVMIHQADGTPDIAMTSRFVDGLLDRGIYFHPTHNMFLNAAMTIDDMDLTIDAARDVLADLDR